MRMEVEYTSRLNGAAYLLFELKQVVKLKHLGLSTEEIRGKVIQENLFQFTNIGRVRRALPSVMQRADVLDNNLVSLMLEGPIELAKVINLYTIMKTDLLFYEFMHEVVSEKLHNNIYQLEKKDLNLFFTVKAEQSERVASWSAINIEKLKRVYVQILYESGYLRHRQGSELTRIIIDERLKDHLYLIGDGQYVQAMGEER